MGQLAQISGISKVVLSQIEKGDSNPTINTIWKIAAGLNVPYTKLLEQGVPETQIVRKQETLRQASEDGQYRHFCYYQSSPTRNFELFQIEIESGAFYTSPGHAACSEEYLLVTHGELSIELNGKTFILSENEAIRFSASEPHIYSNKGNKLAEAVIINFYPN